MAGRVAASGAQLSAQEYIRYILSGKPLLECFPIELRVMSAVGLGADITYGTDVMPSQQIDELFDMMV